MSLSIVGCGVDPSRHLTIEGHRALQAADLIVSLMPKAWLARLPPDVGVVSETLFDQYYATGRHRPSVYAEVASAIKEEARTSEVAFAVQGGPSWYDSIVGLLIDACGVDGTPCRLVAGVSAVEAVLTRLQQQIAPSLLITDAASLIDGRTSLDAGRPTLIMQPHVAMTAAVLSGVMTPTSTIQALGTSLARTYAPGHVVVAVVVAGEWAEDKLSSVTVGDLQAGIQIDLRGASLFIRQWD